MEPVVDSAKASSVTPTSSSKSPQRGSGSGGSGAAPAVKPHGTSVKLSAAKATSPVVSKKDDLAVLRLHARVDRLCRPPRREQEQEPDARDGQVRALLQGGRGAAAARDHLGRARSHAGCDDLAAEHGGPKERVRADRAQPERCQHGNQHGFRNETMNGKPIALELQFLDSLPKSGMVEFDYVQIGRTPSHPISTKRFEQILSICQLELMEPTMGETIDELIPGWELNMSWLKDGDFSEKGYLCLEYYSGVDKGCGPMWHTRRELASGTLCGLPEAEADEIINYVDSLTWGDRLDWHSDTPRSEFVKSLQLIASHDPKPAVRCDRSTQSVQRE